MCDIPSFELLMGAIIDEPLTWDAVGWFRKSLHQSHDSFAEQKFAITQCIKAVDSYRDAWNGNTYIKNVLSLQVFLVVEKPSA